MNKKILRSLPIAFGVVLLLLASFLRFSGKLDKGRKQVLLTSELIKIEDISEFHTAQFEYNGIAEIYKGKDSKKVDCYISYKAKVKAGITEDVKYTIDKVKKIIKPELPELSFSVTMVDESNFSFIPTDAKYDIDTVFKVCEDDARTEANNSTNLKEVAMDNLKSSIEAFFYPLTEEGYTINWDKQF